MQSNTALDADTAALLGITAPADNIVPLNPEADPLSFLNGTEQSAPTKTGKVYPVLPDPNGEAAALARRILELARDQEQFDAAKKTLGGMALPFFFRHWAGQPEFESSIQVCSEIGNVLVTCQKKVKKMEDTKPLAPVAHLLKRTIGGVLRDLQKEWFAHTFELKIDGDEIPPQVAPALVNELKAVFAKHGCPKALKSKREYRPYPAFYTQRMVVFSPEENLQFNEAVPITTMVKTKGVN